MKKSVTILLLLIFVFNALGFWIVFKVRQNQVYAEAKARVKKALKNSLPESELYYFELSEGEVLPSGACWIKPQKEFSVDNQLYDIVRIEYKEDKTVLCCISDDQEKKLFTNLEEHIQKHISENSKSDASKKNKVDKKTNDWYELLNQSCFLYGYINIKYDCLIQLYEQLYLNTDTHPPSKSLFEA